MDLVVVRHAMAWDSDPGRWPDDRKRPLRPVGMRRFRAAARALARAVPHADAVWTSPWVRAAQTAAILQEEARWPKAQSVEVLATASSPAPVMRLVSAVARPGTLVLVGHAPSLDQLVTLAVTGRSRPALVELKKGGVACVRFENSVRTGAGELLWLMTPRFLRSVED